MTRPFRQYAALGFLLACTLLNQSARTWFQIEDIRNRAAAPDNPFPIQVGTRTIGSGPLHGNKILAINGRPFNAYIEYVRAVETAHPGDKLLLTLSRRSGEAFETSVVIPHADNYDSVASFALLICLQVLIPLVALGLGFTVVAIRPKDGNAWLLLLMMLGFTEMARQSQWSGPGWIAMALWNSVWTASWPIFMLLFGIYFPNRLGLDRRHPWLKYLVIAPALIMGLFFHGIGFVWFFNIDAALPWRALFTRVYFLNMVMGMVAIGCFFACLGYKTATEPSADCRRRLKILRAGSSLALTPIFLLVIYSIVRDSDLFAHVPWPIIFASLVSLVIFPLTLAYVIVVERAMDLRVVIRQSLRYGLARVSLWLVRASLIALAIYLFQSASRGGGTLKPIELGGVGVGLLALRRRGADRASEWVDRKFFRESYNAEKVLSELAGEVGRYVQIDPLLEKVANRISDILHVPDIVVLLRDGDVYAPRYSTRSGEPMPIHVTGQIAANLRERNETLEIYYDKPPLWIHSLNAEELQTLSYMRTQLLLPLRGQDQLAGIMSLGPKLSETPYTDTDIRLLQAIASQMGLALENSRLLISLAAEAADRERANRELEIAREVQERLFPQNYPVVPGLDCAGYCRPARGVGGDYYDFLQLADGRLGIAIGDVSGKGIAAALLMASLQASLRGQTMAGVHDLAALMDNVNKLVYEASTSSRYATFFYSEYHPATRMLSFVNAGHNPPVVLRGEEVIRLEACGPVVGLLPGAGYGQAEFRIDPGDIFIAFTDGISEAMNESDEEWDEDRFIAAAKRFSSLSAKGMIESLFHAADQFTGAAKQYDDMTLLIMKFAS